MESGLINLDSQRYKQELKAIKGTVDRTQSNTESFASGKSHNTQSLKHYEEVVKDIAKLLDQYKALCYKDLESITNMAVNFEEYERKMQETFAK